MATIGDVREMANFVTRPNPLELIILFSLFVRVEMAACGPMGHLFPVFGSLRKEKSIKKEDCCKEQRKINTTIRERV